MPIVNINSDVLVNVWVETLWVKEFLDGNMTGYLREPYDTKKYIQISIPFKELDIHIPTGTCNRVG